MSLITSLLLLWAAVTAIFVTVMIWKSLVGLKEEDVVILDPAEASQAAEQQQIIARVERLTMWAKRFGLASLALLLVTGTLWMYQGFVAFNSGRIP